MDRQSLWNWTKAAIGLRHVRNALQALVVTHVTTFYNSLQCRQPSRMCQCNQKTVANTKPTRGSQCPTCQNIYQRLIAETINKSPMISNCKVENWRTNEWEVAKAFIPGVGYKDIDSADATDVSGMIGICLNVTFIRRELIQSDLDAFNKVRDIRNKVFHSSTMKISIEDFEAYIQTMLDMLDDRLAKSEDDIWKGFQTAKEALGKLPRQPLCEHCLEQIDCNKDALIALNVDATQLIDKLEQPQPDADTLQTQEKLAAIFNTQNVHSGRIACQEQKMDKTMHTLSSIPIHQKETVKIREKIKDSLAKQGIAMQPTLCEALKHDVKIFQPKQLFQNAPAKQDDRDKDELVLEILKGIQQAQNEMKLEMLTLKETVNDIQNKIQEATDEDLKIQQDDNDPNYGSNSKTDIQTSNTSCDPINDTAFPRPESHEVDTEKVTPDKDTDNNSRETVSGNDVDIARTESDTENNPSGTEADSIGEDPNQAEIHPGDDDINVLARSMRIMSNEKASALSLQKTNAGNEDTTGAKSPNSPVLKFSKDFDIKPSTKVYISGITQLTPTTVVTASFPNILSLVDLSTRKVTSELKLPGLAWDVTTVSYNQMAVTLPSNQTVQFVSVAETSPGTFTMMKTNAINMAGDCLGIDYRNNKLAVTHIKHNYLEQGRQTGVRVMNMSGEVEYDISSNDSNKIKRQFGSVKFAPSGQELFVTCEDDAVRKISLTGEVLACYRNRNLLDPRGLVTMTDGELLVCGFDSNTVHVVGRDGVMRTVLTKKDGIKSPLSLCLCEDTGKLCVGMEVTGKLGVFDMLHEQ